MQLVVVPLWCLNNGKHAHVWDQRTVTSELWCNIPIWQLQHKLTTRKELTDDMIMLAQSWTVVKTSIIYTNHLVRVHTGHLTPLYDTKTITQKHLKHIVDLSNKVGIDSLIKPTRTLTALNFFFLIGWNRIYRPHKEHTSKTKMTRPMQMVGQIEG